MMTRVELKQSAIDYKYGRIEYEQFESAVEAFEKALLQQTPVSSSLPLLQAVMEEIQNTDADFFGGEDEKQDKIERYQSVIQFISELEAEGQ